MEEKDLLRTENDENQFSNATPAAEEPAQEHVIADTTEQQSEPAVASEETAQTPSEEPAAESVQEEQAEPAPAETPAEAPAAE